MMEFEEGTSYVVSANGDKRKENVYITVIQDFFPLIYVNML